MSKQEPSSQASKTESGFTCDNCLDGMVVPIAECLECGPTRVVRKPDPKISRRLASDEWRSLFDRARQHLGASDTRQSLLAFFHSFEIVIGDEIFPDADTGELIDFDHEESLLAPAQAFLVETGRVAHALAAWLGTSSVIPVTMSLMTGFPLNASHLAPAKRGTASDAYMAAMTGLVGGGLPSGTFQGVFAAALKGFRKGTEEAGLGWEEARVAWDRASPGRRFETMEAFRRAVGRARKRKRG